MSCETLSSHRQMARLEVAERDDYVCSWGTSLGLIHERDKRATPGAPIELRPLFEKILRRGSRPGRRRRPHRSNEEWPERLEARDAA